MQLLMINLVTDSLPAIALGMEDVDKDIMTRKPKPKNEGLFANGFGVRIILQGFMFGILSLAAFKIGYNGTEETLKIGQTMTFFVLAMSQVIQSFNMRSDRSLFKTGIFTNKTLNKAVLVYYKVLQTGEGKSSPTVRSIVTVHYKGTLIDGKEFDNSYQRSCPEAFRLCDVIDGWQLALQRMHVGDKWIIYIPYTMGYGTRPSGPIPAFSTLIFEVELLGIVITLNHA